MSVSESLEGRLLGGRYRIARQLGEGGMGAVYEAVQENLGRRVAVKVLAAELRDDVKYIERFRREAEAAGRLMHPHIVQVTDFVQTPGEPVLIVMELLEGEPLLALLKRERITVARACRIAVQLLSALEAAHASGIVHRDLKPANIFLVPLAGGGDLVKLLDFGIAKLQESDGYRRLTQTGILIGTPRYAAPEQIASHPVLDGRTDLYAAGVLLFGMLAGRPPFMSSGAQLLVDIQDREPPDLLALAPSVPPALAAAVVRALRKRPDERFQSAPEMRAALASFADASGPAPGAAELASSPGANTHVGFATRGPAFASGPAPGAASKPRAPASWDPSAPSAPDADATAQSRPRGRAAAVAAPVDPGPAPYAPRSSPAPSAQSALSAQSASSAQSPPSAQSAPSYGLAAPAPAFAEPVRSSPPAAPPFGFVPPAAVAQRSRPGLPPTIPMHAVPLAPAPPPPRTSVPDAWAAPGPVRSSRAPQRSRSSPPPRGVGSAVRTGVLIGAIALVAVLVLAVGAALLWRAARSRGSRTEETAPSASHATESTASVAQAPAGEPSAVPFDPAARARVQVTAAARSYGPDCVEYERIACTCPYPVAREWCADTRLLNESSLDASRSINVDRCRRGIAEMRARCRP